LENYVPKKESIAVFDLKDFLFMGMILKEKDFREALKQQDWEKYRNKNVAIVCSLMRSFQFGPICLLPHTSTSSKRNHCRDEKEIYKTVF
jgi:hypothetical protein